MHTLKKHSSQPNIHNDNVVVINSVIVSLASGLNVFKTNFGDFDQFLANNLSIKQQHFGSKILRHFSAQIVKKHNVVPSCAKTTVTWAP
jgi:hypothetical protein